ncbi:MAG: hypothetical protein FWE28_03010 [Oscillospiraceae bacterium]|nr:hypothetical protein [Oscillospiraceae bacterium]
MKRILLIAFIALTLLSLTACLGYHETETTYEEQAAVYDVEGAEKPEILEVQETPEVVETPEILDVPATWEWLDVSDTPRVPIIWADMDREGLDVSYVPHRSFFEYGDAMSLYYDATDVIRGQVLDIRTDWLNRNYPPDIPLYEGVERYEVFTVFHVRVWEVFKGEHQPGEIVEVAQAGGMIDGQLVINRNQIPIAAGDDLVFFLLNNIRSTPAGVLSPIQATYHFTPLGSSDRARERGFHEVLECVSNPDHNLVTLTIADMIEMKIHSFGYEAALELDWVDETELQEYLARR